MKATNINCCFHVHPTDKNKISAEYNKCHVGFICWVRGERGERRETDCKLALLLQILRDKKIESIKKGKDFDVFLVHLCLGNWHQHPVVFKLWQFMHVLIETSDLRVNLRSNISALTAMTGCSGRTWEKIKGGPDRHMSSCRKKKKVSFF